MAAQRASAPLGGQPLLDGEAQTWAARLEEKGTEHQSPAGPALLIADFGTAQLLKQEYMALQNEPEEYGRYMADYPRDAAGERELVGQIYNAIINFEDISDAMVKRKRAAPKGPATARKRRRAAAGGQDDQEGEDEGEEVGAGDDAGLWEDGPKVRRVKALSRIEVELLAWDVLRATADAQNGLLGFGPWSGSDWGYDQSFPTFRARLDVVLKALAESKALVSSLLDSSYLRRVAAHPEKERKRKLANKQQNQLRDAQVKAGIDAIKGNQVAIADGAVVASDGRVIDPRRPVPRPVEEAMASRRAKPPRAGNNSSSSSSNRAAAEVQARPETLLPPSAPSLAPAAPIPPPSMPPQIPAFPFPLPAVPPPAPEPTPAPRPRLPPFPFPLPAVEPPQAPLSAPPRAPAEALVTAPTEPPQPTTQRRAPAPAPVPPYVLPSPQTTIPSAAASTYPPARMPQTPGPATAVPAPSLAPVTAPLSMPQPQGAHQHQQQQSQPQTAQQPTDVQSVWARLEATRQQHKVQQQAPLQPRLGNPLWEIGSSFPSQGHQQGLYYQPPQYQPQYEQQCLTSPAQPQAEMPAAFTTLSSLLPAGADIPSEPLPQPQPEPEREPEPEPEPLPDLSGTEPLPPTGDLDSDLFGDDLTIEQEADLFAAGWPQADDDRSPEGEADFDFSI